LPLGPPQTAESTDLVSNAGLQREGPVTNHLRHVEVSLNSPPSHLAQLLAHDVAEFCWNCLCTVTELVLRKTLQPKRASPRAVQQATCARLYAPHFSLSPMPLATAQCCNFCISRPTVPFTNVTIFK
jgi:hypothetical protein